MTADIRPAFGWPYRLRPGFWQMRWQRRTLGGSARSILRRIWQGDQTYAHPDLHRPGLRNPIAFIRHARRRYGR
jgi:hypothetical protein